MLNHTARLTIKHFTSFEQGFQQKMSGLKSEKNKLFAICQKLRLLKRTPTFFVLFL